MVKTAGDSTLSGLLGLILYSMYQQLKENPRVKASLAGFTILLFSHLLMAIGSFIEKLLSVA